VVRSGNSAALLTYYAVDAVGLRPSPLPSVDILDVAYLPSVILAAADLPLSDATRERIRLMIYCKGRYHGCSQIPQFHRQLINAGIVDAW
jgi:hypothetical protein